MVEPCRTLPFPFTRRGCMAVAVVCGARALLPTSLLVRHKADKQLGLNIANASRSHILHAGFSSEPQSQYSTLDCTSTRSAITLHERPIVGANDTQKKNRERRFAAETSDQMKLNAAHLQQFTHRTQMHKYMDTVKRQAKTVLVGVGSSSSAHDIN